MAMGPIKFLSIILVAVSSSAFADEAGRAAAKGYAHGNVQPPAAKDASARPQNSAPGPGRMQVEEPAAAASNPDARDSKAWQKIHAKGLTDAQKAAFRERKEKMEGMIALIKAKRKALQDAKPQERAALARELHSLILEKDTDPSEVASAASVRSEENGASASSPASSASTPAEAQKSSSNQKNSEAQAQRREEIRERQYERIKKSKGKDDGD
jgi:hypothetical protein